MLAKMAGECPLIRVGKIRVMYRWQSRTLTTFVVGRRGNPQNWLHHIRCPRCRHPK